MLRVGLTGGVASGKSSVLRLLAERGAVAFSADEAARATLAPDGCVLRRIREAFGDGVFAPDGTLLRKRLAAIVFDDAEARQTLNRITHPPILRLLHFQMESAQHELSPKSIVVVEIPLLYEEGLQGWFDLVAVVSAPQEAALKRLASRNGLTQEEAIKRLQSQTPLEEKAAKADIVVENNGGLQELATATDNLWRLLQTRNRQKSL